MITHFLTAEGSTYQFVQPQNLRVNATEKAIHKFKIQLISGLCANDPAFTTQPWDYLVPHAHVTINILLIAQVKRTISAYRAV